MKDYGKILRALRKNANMTQNELAEQLHVTYQTVSKWENGINSPDLDTVERICGIFGIGVDVFFLAVEVGQTDPPSDSATDVAPPNAQPPHPVTELPKRKSIADLPYVIVSAVLAVFILISAICVGILNAKPSANRIYETVDPSVFCITVDTKSDKIAGSGFFIDSHGTAVTNHHVIRDMTAARVQLSNGKTYNVDRILGIDSIRDIAIIHVAVKSSKPVKLAKSNKVKVGDTVYAIGYPESFTLGNRESTFTKGIVSKSAFEVDGVHYIQSTVDITHGNSGGVLVNDRGYVIGITTAGIDLTSYMNLSIPVRHLSTVKRDINLSVTEFAQQYSNKKTVKYMIDGTVYKETKLYAYEHEENLRPTLANGDIFDGWYDDAHFESPHDFAVPSKSDITLYGKVRHIVLTVRFDGGEGATGSMSDASGEANKPIVLPANGYRRTGYLFDGWAYGGKTYREGDTIQSDIGGLVTVKAVWKPIAYTVRFAYNGAVKKTETYTYGEPHDLPRDLYSRIGYTMTGWMHAQNRYTYADRTFDLTTTAGAIVEMTPLWTPISYKVRVEAGYPASWSLSDSAKEYDADESAYVTATYGEAPLQNSTAILYGLQFVEWEFFDADGNLYNGDLRYINADPAKTVTARAKWISARRYELQIQPEGAYSTGGGSGAVTVYLREDEEYTLPKASTWIAISEGHEFSHYEQKSTIDGEVHRYKEGETVSDLMTKGQFLTGYAFIVPMKAIIVPIEYTVRFDANGGEGSMNDTPYTYMENDNYYTPYALPPCMFTREGHWFAGWTYGDGNRLPNETEFYSLTSVKETVTLQAQWVPALNGKGTETEPYTIGNYDELYRLADIIGYVDHSETAHYILTADIDCAGKSLFPICTSYKNTWTSDLPYSPYNYGTFRGIFDGRNHVISNAVFAQRGIYSGLFGNVFDGQIRNVGIVNYTVPDDVNRNIVAPLACNYISTHTLENCFAEGTVYASDHTVYMLAGLVAQLSGAAEDCYAAIHMQNGKVNSFGGFANAICGGMFERTKTSNIEKKTYTLQCSVPVNEPLVTRCFADVDVTFSATTASNAYIGGFAAEGRTKDSFSVGTIELPDEKKYWFVKPFSGSTAASSSENCFTSASIRINGTIAERTESGVTATEQENLYSLAWLRDNLGFDDTIWEIRGGKPTLKAFGGAA